MSTYGAVGRGLRMLLLEDQNVILSYKRFGCYVRCTAPREGGPLKANPGLVDDGWITAFRIYKECQRKKDWYCMDSLPVILGDTPCKLAMCMRPLCRCRLFPDLSNGCMTLRFPLSSAHRNLLKNTTVDQHRLNALRETDKIPATENIKTSLTITHVTA